MCHRFEPIFAELSKRKEYSQLMFAKVDVEKLKVGGIIEGRGGGEGTPPSTKSTHYLSLSLSLSLLSFF